MRLGLPLIALTLVGGCRGLNPDFAESPDPATSGLMGPGTGDGDGDDSGNASTTDPPPTTGTTGTSDGSTTLPAEETGAEPMVEHLQNSDQSACDGWVWCTDGFGDPLGGPVWDQECFHSTLAPPFELTEVHYIVGAIMTSLGEVSIEVRSGGGSGPGQVIATRPISTAVDAQPGDHTIVFDDPVVIDTQDFCVGVSAVQPGLSSAIALAVDSPPAGTNSSYIRYGSDGACNIPNFAELGGTIGEIATWCLDVEVRK